MRLLNIILVLLSLASTCIFNSCAEEKEGSPQEGMIEFDTKGVDEKHPFHGLAPSSATLKYNKDKFCMEMSTMGMFNIVIIGDANAKTMVQTVKFLDIKQACIEKEDDIEKENKEYELKIEETEETKKIAGLTCHKLNVTMVSDTNVKFDAWYTKELGMENCNALNPYSQVKGMLMDYRAKRMGLEMHFVARSVKHPQVPQTTFEIPASLKIVKKDEMQKLFESWQ